jgi:hypothetical protein
MGRAACLITVVALTGCTDGPRPCGETPKIYPATGSGAAVSGALVPAHRIKQSPCQPIGGLSFTPSRATERT